MDRRDLVYENLGAGEFLDLDGIYLLELPHRSKRIVNRLDLAARHRGPRTDGRSGREALEE
jgi:hypothetical protein